MLVAFKLGDLAPTKASITFDYTVVPLLRDHPVVHTDGGLSRGVVLHQGWAEFH